MKIAELDQDYVYYVDNSIPFKDQVIHSEGKKHLLNVRKIYTDNVYFGVQYTVYTPEIGLSHQFRCKDRPLGDLSVVENKDSFISAIKDDMDSIKRVIDKGHRQEEQNFNLPYKVFFCFDMNDNYVYTLYELFDGTSLRGLYGADSLSHLTSLKKSFNGFATFGVPSRKEVISFYEYKKTSLSNNQISVSTDYSSIIIEHVTQYNHKWSDIRRRKHGS